LKKIEKMKKNRAQQNKKRRKMTVLAVKLGKYAYLGRFRGGISPHCEAIFFL